MRFNGRGLMALLVVLLMFALVISACAPEEAVDDPDPGEPAEPDPDPQDDVPRGEYVHSSTTDPANFNDILHSDTTSGWVCSRIYSSMFNLVEDYVPEGDLVTDYEFTDDGLTYTFYLRDDVYFHDGVQLTAEDVAFTYNAMKHPDYTGPRAAVYMYVDYVEAVDDFTVRFHLTEPDGSLIGTLIRGILPAHLFEDTPIGDMLESPHSLEDPIGSGPYKFVEYQPGRHVILEANPDYYGEGPYIETMVLRIVEDSDVALAAFEAGELDYVGIPGTEKDRMLSEFTDTHWFETYRRAGQHYMIVQTQQPGLDDYRVRQAMLYGMDRESMIDGILEGEGYIRNTPIPSINWAYVPEFSEMYKYNPDRSIEILEDAGYTRGDDGVFEKGDVRLEFDLHTNAGNVARTAFCLVIQDNFEDIGIKANVHFVDWVTFRDRHLWYGDYDLCVKGRTGPSWDPCSLTQFHSSQAERQEDGRFVGPNRQGYQSEVLDDILERGRLEADFEKRKEIYREFQQYFVDYVPGQLIITGRYTTVGFTNDIDRDSVRFNPGGPILPWLWRMAD